MARAVRTAFAPVISAFVSLPGPSPSIVIDTRQGEPIQTLTLDPQQPAIGFALGKGQVFGLGEGGPQFDRKGSTFGTRNGQGGYQLRTHGGRVPIQWLVSPDGWGMYIHQPLGAFDLTGTRGHVHAGQRRAAARCVRRRHRTIRRS